MGYEAGSRCAARLALQLLSSCLCLFSAEIRGVRLYTSGNLCFLTGTEKISSKYLLNMKVSFHLPMVKCGKFCPLEG